MHKWTEDEVQYLHDNLGIMGYNELSQNLGRSKNAIKLYRCRHKLPTFYDNIYSYNLLSDELGRSRKTLRKYHRRGWLKGKVASWSCKWGKHPMIFLEKDIVAFLRKHFSRFDWRKIPNLYFRNVVKSCVEV